MPDIMGWYWYGCSNIIRGSKRPAPESFFWRFSSAFQVLPLVTRENGCQFATEEFSLLFSWGVRLSVCALIELSPCVLYCVCDLIFFLGGGFK